ncbi:hypothetical protein SBOR_5501 [Sclerotinia borealis F-4128]|uniref:Adhesin domain-containing protein n=1 Tax=Sclerotinia borealis (strain F-4128) TaxID=1432307 RepID=W9CE23_SCLBF|nr:hypothetical protein SBOR_5501 [Sclerotinia borealis F-4128]
MPYSDNLYRAIDDSGNNRDGEDSDELSPIDGYFNSNQIPQDMIPDPTLSQEDNLKARKAREESPRDGEISSTRQMSSYINLSAHATENSRTSLHSFPASSHRRRDESFSQHQPFFDQPPPAYIASAESSPVSVQGQHTHTNYNTFSQHRLEEGRSREPQSMGRPGGNPEMNGRTPLWLYRTPKKIPFQKKIITKVLGVGLVLTIVAAFLSTVFIPNPNMGGGSRFSSPIHNGGPYCQHISKSEQTTFEIPNVAGIKVLQDFYKQDLPHDGRELNHVTTAGEVRIRNLPSSSKKGKAHFTVDVKLSDPEYSVVKTWNEDDGTLKISTPRFAPPGTSENPCISIEVTAWVPEDVEIPNVFFDLVTLSIRLFLETNIKVAGDTVLKTVSGDVHFPKHSHLSTGYTPITAAEFQSQRNFEFDSRSIIVETVSGRIEGTYPLYDLLRLSSQSGTIGVDIYPKPVLRLAPAPATLDIHTSSGRIEVQSPVKIPQAIFPREYITRVESISGAIQGDFFVGSTGIFKTSSSRIQLVVKPVLPTTSDNDDDDDDDDDDDVKIDEFSTYSISGSTHVTLLDPLFILPSAIDYTHENPIDHYSTPSSGLTTLSSTSPIQPYKSLLHTFHSTHKTTSGRIEAYYPSSWIGNILAKTISGRIEMEGKGIQIVERNDSWGFKRIKARKGVDRDEDGGSVVLETVNGAIALRIAEGL